MKFDYHYISENDKYIETKDYEIVVYLDKFDKNAKKSEFVNNKYLTTYIYNDKIDKNLNIVDYSKVYKKQKEYALDTYYEAVLDIKDIDNIKSDMKIDRIEFLDENINDISKLIDMNYKTVENMFKGYKINKTNISKNDSNNIFYLKQASDNVAISNKAYNFNYELINNDNKEYKNTFSNKINITETVKPKTVKFNILSDKKDNIVKILDKNNIKYDLNIIGYKQIENEYDTKQEQITIEIEPIDLKVEHFKYIIDNNINLKIQKIDIKDALNEYEKVKELLDKIGVKIRTKQFLTDDIYSKNKVSSEKYIEYQLKLENIKDQEKVFKLLQENNIKISSIEYDVDNNEVDRILIKKAIDDTLKCINDIKEYRVVKISQIDKQINNVFNEIQDKITVYSNILIQIEFER